MSITLYLSIGIIVACLLLIKDIKYAMSQNVFIVLTACIVITLLWLPIMFYLVYSYSESLVVFLKDLLFKTNINKELEDDNNT